MRSPRPSASTEAGFTLVEMLVAMAILALIMVLVSQLTNSAMLSTGLSGKHLDTDSEARAVFDRMSADFARMPQRKDVDFIFAKQPGSDKMFFFSEAPGYFDTTNSSLFPSAGGNSTDPRSSVSLIGYCINTGSNNSGTALTPPAYCLQRLSKGLAWDAQSPATGNPGGVFFLTFAPGNLYPLTASTLAGNSYTSAAVGSPPAYSGTDPDFDVVANLVLRMEFCFQVKDLTNPNSPASAYSNYPIAHFAAGAANQATAQSSAPSNPSVGDRWYDTANNRAYLCAWPDRRGAVLDAERPGGCICYHCRHRHPGSRQPRSGSEPTGERLERAGRCHRCESCLSAARSYGADVASRAEWSEPHLCRQCRNPGPRRGADTCVSALFLPE